MRGLLIAWLCCQALAELSAQESELSVSMLEPGPGSYSSPVSLALKVPAGASVHYRFLESPTPQTLPWTPPLVLEALPGETRLYRLRLTTDLTTGETVTKDYLYRISSPAAPVPTVRPSPGPYTSAISVQASLPAGWSVVQGTSKVVFPLVLDAATGERRNFILEAQGPRGQTLTWSYEVDKRDQDQVGLDLISPKPGVWANAQPLVVDFKGIDQVLWSYGDHFDPATARPYTGPVVLDGAGEKSVTVSGHSRLGGWMERSVHWTNGSDADPAGWPVSGVRTSGLELPALSGWLESWDEGRSWQPCQALAGEKASSVSRKVLVVQIKKELAASRYVYWLDARPPLTPETTFVGGWNPQVWFSGSADALHRVTWTLSNGTTLDETSSLWGPVGSWKVPDHAVAALVTSHGTNGLSSVSKTVQFSETGWSTPEWEPWDQNGPLSNPALLPLGGRIIPRPGFWPVYEVSDQPAVAEPGLQSPLLEGAFLPTVPWGADRTFYVRFAWRDAAGLIGPASATFAVRVDRIPPLAPEIVEQGGQIVIKAAEGEEEGSRLLWAVTSERVGSPDALNFQPYVGPLDVATLRTTAGIKPWIHAIAQDRAGNSGQPRLNVALSPAAADVGVVQVDPDPAIGEIAVSNGGVYPWNQLRLRSLDRRSDLWVGAAEPAAGVPKDWRIQVKPWNGIFSRSISGGGRRSFLVYWNAKTLSGWVWDQPKTVSVTLDLGPPVVPVLTVPWPKTPLAAAWTLTLQPGQLGDVLRYSFTLDGTPPSDPAAGDPWPGTRTWDAQAGTRTQVRIRMAAVSVSGASAEIPLGEAVVIDKAPPPAVSPALAPFTYQTTLLTVPLPTASPSVRYSLTSDGSLPEVPSSSSPLVDSAGLRLEGIEGKNVLYRFRWRSYSAAGLPGPVSEAFAVLVDRTGVSLASPEPGSASRALVSGPRLSGLPSSGISAGPVTLQADWPQGLLRYEVVEGAGSPRSVSADSPLWDKPLVLDGGAGVDRLFAVSVRGFSPDGQPQTPEAHYSVRVDRSVPLAPNFELSLDPRRPEVAFERPGNQSPDEVMFYRWSWESFPDGKGQTEWAPVPPEPPRFSAPDGTLTMLRVEAFLKDEAGNSGPVTDRAALIDQNVVYVAAQGAGDGSREHPFGTVAQAIEKIRRDGKSILFVGSGVYTVGKTLDLDGLQVYGGWNPALWEKTADPGRSVWAASPPFEGSSLLESGERPWTLTRVDLASSGVPLQRLAVVRGARVAVRDSAWTVSGVEGGWDQIGGALDSSNIAVTYAARPKGSLFSLQSVEVALRGLNVAETLNQDGALLDFQDCQALVQNLSVVSKNAKGLDVVWKAVRSWLTVDGARILAGDGAERATAFVFKETAATFWNSDVALYGSLANTGFQTAGGRLELQKANLSLLRGEEFNQGLVCDQSDVVLRTFQLKVESGSYQGGLTVNGGSLTFASGGIQLAGGGQRAWGAQFQESCIVTFRDVNWVLTTKTTSDLWKIEKPWSKGSTVVGSTTTGW